MNRPNFFSESFVFHHIGSLTSNIEDAEKIFSILGFNFTKRIYDPIQEVNLSFGKNKLGILLELVEPKEKSKVANLLNRNGAGPYHFCFEVGSISKEENKLKEQGFICVMKPEKAVAFDNRCIAFYFSQVCGLVELLEK